MGVKSIPFHDEFKIDKQILATESPYVFLENNPEDVESRRKYSFLECNTRGILSKCILKVELKHDSLPDVTLPNYTIEDTEAEQLQKTLELQWNSARYQGVIWANESLTDESSWAKGDFFSILNTSGVPYVNYNILKMLTTDIFEGLGRQCRIGISFQDVGWGLPKLTDKLTLKATWAQQGHCVVNEESPIMLIGGTVQQVIQYASEVTRTIGVASTQLFGVRQYRKSVSIKNNSTSNTISYSFTQNFARTEGTVASGATATISSGSLDEIWIKASAATSVTGTDIYNIAI